MTLDFVLALHSHLPWMLNRGRWPHGSDWLCEAALETYLPLLEELRALEDDGVPAPVTLGITPVLANQLAHPAFRAELDRFFAQRLEACAEAPVSLAATNDEELLPLVAFWKDRYRRHQALWERIDKDLVGAFRALELRGRVELMSSAATHGFLPLLARDESIRLQLGLGVAEHRRLFGRSPLGCWVPECAYRPRDRWAPWPTAPRATLRRGIEEHLADAGYRYFFVDAHLVTGGRPIGLSSGAEPLLEAVPLGEGERTPYRTWRVASGGTGSVSCFARDPRASAQVWSRQLGYPGDGAYLEFHKLRWPGGLRFWRVTGSDVDLGAKASYDPAAAASRAEAHAAHFARLVDRIAAEQPARGRVLAAPFDTELFGHWWFEGPHFLGSVYRALTAHADVRPVSAGGHLLRHRPGPALRLPPGSWGANGDWSVWLSPLTAWTWERLWALEEAYWEVAPAALRQPATRVVLAQATRSLLLAQASDWQFLISGMNVADYAVERFNGHCDDAEALVAALQPGREDGLEAALRRAEEAGRRDDCFPDPLPAVEAALAGTRALAFA